MAVYPGVARMAGCWGVGDARADSHSQGGAMPTRHLSCCSRFTLPLLLCGLLWTGLERGSFAADLTASSPHPTVNFDDTDTAANPDWAIIADDIAFDVIDF